MAYSITDYLQMFLNLLPKGRAWSRSPDSILYKLMHGNAVELIRIDARLDDLKTERRGGQSDELLADHERDLGLPDDCTYDVLTLTQRRNAVHARIIDEGGLNQQSYIDFADDLGWDITITTFNPFICGLSECGDEIGDSDNIFTWLVEIDMSTQSLDADSGPLVCFLNKYKPAHTHIIYELVGVEFSSAFSTAFDAIPSDSIAYNQGAFSKSYSSAFDVYLGDTLFIYDDTILEDDIILEDETIMGG